MPRGLLIGAAAALLLASGWFIATVIWAALGIGPAGQVGWAQSWKDLIGSALGAGIGGLIGVYIGRQSNQTIIRTTSLQAKLADAVAMRDKWEAIQRNVLNHGMALERISRSLVWYSEFLGQEGSRPFRLSLMQSAIENSVFALPHVLDPGRSAIDFTGYGKPELLTRFLDDIASLDATIRSFIGVTVDRNSDTMSTHDSEVILAMLLRSNDSCRAFRTEVDTARQYAKEKLMVIEQERQSILAAMGAKSR